MRDVSIRGVAIRGVVVRCACDIGFYLGRGNQNMPPPFKKKKKKKKKKRKCFLTEKYK